MEKKKTLLEKYEMPLSHLDFGYIGNCKDARELEKIVQILRSGEEGYFPDLTKCAENKLHELKPTSKLFRFEEKVRSRDHLCPNEWKPIYDWTHDIKTKDKKLLQLSNRNDTPANSNNTDITCATDIPPIRKGGKINQTNFKQTTTTTTTNQNATTKSVERIKSTDYHKWDQYDPDEEILRIDLAEEREKEQIERMNRLNLQKSSLSSNIMTNQTTVNREETKIKHLTELEREKLAEEYRLRGNEYFRAKEYENAIGEYNRAIQTCPNTAAPVYNNRAIANIKLQKFSEAILDCEQCLSIQPNNVKARLRLADATYALGKRRESYDLYLNVLKLDSAHSVALKAIQDLRVQFPEMPPTNATRIQIHETTKTGVNKTKASIIPSTVKIKPDNTNKFKDHDFADLVIPNRVVKNKLATAAETLDTLRACGLQKMTNRNVNEQNMPSTSATQPQPELYLPSRTTHSMGKILIEEI